jgi:hypothetical protein
LISITFLVAWLTGMTFSSHAQGPRPKASPKPKPGEPQRLTFAEAQSRLEGEAEGNLAQRSNIFSRTRLRSGQVLELYYPIAPPKSSGKSRTAGVPGYGLLYESEAAYRDSIRPRHILEDLIPDAQGFLGSIPQLVASLQKRLRASAQALDYSPASLKRIDLYIASYQRSHTTADTDPQLFQELTAYYGETLRRAVNGEWRVRHEPLDRSRAQAEPNIIFGAGSASGELKPWDSVVTALHDDNHKGKKLSAALSADVEAARDASRRR